MQLRKVTVYKKLKEMFMAKDCKCKRLEDRVEQLETIIDEMIVDIVDNDLDDECLAILPNDIIEEMEKIVKANIDVIGIT